MEVMEAILTRHSTRGFIDKPVSKDLLEEIASAGTYAASGKNRQPVTIVVVTNPELRDVLSRINADIMGTDGDPFYGTRGLLEETREHRLCLHAASLRITHPMTGRPLEITAPFDFPTF